MALTLAPEVHEAVIDSSARTPPAPPKGSYSPKNALDDLPGTHYALELFLASKMVESEEYCDQCDPKKERLYFATGYGLIQTVKAMMSYEDKDLLVAMNHARHGNSLASQHRKRPHSITTRLAGYVVGSKDTSGVGFIKSMTPVERHAELVYAESLYEKAMLGILYSGDWLAFIKEALNLRTTMNIYRDLGKFLEQADAEATARGHGPEDTSIDAHFRSGVYLGVGASSLVMSLMPTRLLALVEFFGYKGDRHLGLAYLQRAGGWTGERDQPAVDVEQEGVRRSICDMILLIFHLVLSSFTFDGVDIGMADKILRWNVERYPNGVFFLFGEGRLSLRRSQPRQAIACYERAMGAQDQYANLHHISHWEMAIARLALWELAPALASWRALEAGATWSKATYAYGAAACLLELGGAPGADEACRLLARVPELRQRIAGKSIPLEKFVARKAVAFAARGRLRLPALELAYHFHSLTHAPRVVLAGEMLPLVERVAAELDAAAPAPAAGGHWDDVCLARFLEGVCLRFIAYPDADAVPEAGDDDAPGVSPEDAARRAEAAFEAVFALGPKIEVDHYLVYHAHYELGRLLARKGDPAAARRHLELVLSGKPLEINVATKKGRYSMENALQMRTQAALDALAHGRPL